MRYLGGHLGAAVSALVDGQLDPPAADRAWAHVHTCPSCRRAVEREGWVKTRLSAIAAPDAAEEPPERLVGSLYALDRLVGHDAAREESTRAAWAAVEHLERRGRGRRRAGIALVGAGSVSAAVFGLASLSGSTLGIGNAPVSPATSTLSRPLPPAPTTAVVAPNARVHGTIPGDQAGGGLRP
jgi:anti-sigma factor RsiW